MDKPLSFPFGKFNDGGFVVVKSHLMFNQYATWDYLFAGVLTLVTQVDYCLRD